MNSSTIQQDMADFFETRTKKHIILVQKYWGSLLEKNFIDSHLRLWQHDASKFEEPEYTPYLYISWNYKCIAEKVSFEIPEHIKGQCNEATWHHIKNNDHHPEYWDDNLKENPLNTQDRDKPSGIMVDASKMPDLALAEMCCDWCAVAEERGTNPVEWANSNINVRWGFTDRQIKYIYKVMSALGYDKV